MKKEKSKKDNKKKEAITIRSIISTGDTAIRQRQNKRTKIKKDKKDNGKETK